ncbi:MAG TPA: DUF2950 domain-containing protein [Vicinamibacterales bacterium]|jgi:hypothetical protein|nr:DUF2950 domain-containing protein [Vicinamibacterales bacterium]
MRLNIPSAIARSLPVLARLTATALLCVALAIVSSCRKPSAASYHTFATPEDAVQALIKAASTEKIDGILEIFGPEGKELIDTSDPASARRAREVFTAAAAEGWRLVDREGTSKTLVVGNEEWPFPVPLIREASGWRFDTPAGREEVVARRIGRNELSVIDTCETYVLAQHLYARDAHDGKPSGVYAMVLRSDPGRENGLYWPATRGGRRSPLGDRLAGADLRRIVSEDRGKLAPFHGYYFRILTAQGASAPGGAKNYIANGEMTGGFALVAWPAQYDFTGVMTFIVAVDGVVRQKDLGPDTDAIARAVSVYDPDASWTPAR